ncbi:MAG: calcium/sodium antiporter [Bdellovibrionales bacterium]|nr:calcium/sodium antiporter [Bdellovibrionales bacterium]
MFVFYIIILAIGLYFLIAGAELLVKKASLLARQFHVHPFFVGVILLGMGTSAPEWAVSAISSLKGLANLAVANVFGSNLFNILLVLGMILLKPLSKTNIHLIKRDILFLVLSGFILIPLMWNYFLSRMDAFFLTLVFLIYIILSFFSARKRKPPSELIEIPNKRLPLLREVLFIILGFGLLIGGSHLTVIGASYLGEELGMSERLIGILIVSVGTSLPELFASLVAIVKGEKDIAVGNIIGSNIFNTFAILSTAAWIRPVPIDIKMFTIDLPMLLFTHILLLLIIFCYQFKWIQKTLPYIFFSGYICYLFLLW